MKGYPKTLGTKADFKYVMDHYPKEKWLPSLKGLLTNCKTVFFVKWLDSESDGVVDETHLVANEGTEDKAKWAQYEIRVNPLAKIFRLGFTVEEVESLVAKAGNADA